MSDGRRAKLGQVGAVALGLLLAAVVTANAASSVRTADGAVLTVDEIGGKPTAGQAARRSRVLVYSLQDGTGTHSGLVAPTVDAAFDESPVLALDSRSGRPVLIWSRHDGAAMKLAWSRFDAGVWSEARFLTFGPGNDRTPALGTSAAGSYLFWRGVGDSVLHAPLDLETGRLFAAPAALPIPDGGRRPSDGRTPRNPLSPQGGTDAPVIICQNPPCPRTNGAHDVAIGVVAGSPGTIGTTGGTDAPVIICQDPPCVRTDGVPDVPLGALVSSSTTIGTNGGTDAPVGGITTNGGTDAPVIICSNPPCPQTNDVPDVPLGSVSSSSLSLSVVSDPACGSQILLIGSSRGRALLAVEFAGTGRIVPAGRVTIPSGLTPVEAIAGAGSTLLEAACR